MSSKVLRGLDFQKTGKIRTDTWSEMKKAHRPIEWLLSPSGSPHPRPLVICVRSLYCSTRIEDVGCGWEFPSSSSCGISSSSSRSSSSSSSSRELYWWGCLRTTADDGSGLPARFFQRPNFHHLIWPFTEIFGKEKHLWNRFYSWSIFSLQPILAFFRCMFSYEVPTKFLGTIFRVLTASDLIKYSNTRHTIIEFF